jgi:hypothetical protein
MQPTAFERRFLNKHPELNTGFRAVIAYGFLILALCLMVGDFYRLIRAPAAPPIATAGHDRSSRF